MVKGLVKNLQFRTDEGIDISALSKTINDAYLAKAKGGFKTKKSFSPSTIGYGHGNCPRYWYLAFSGANYNETTTAQGMANMENGSFVHDRLQALLTTTGIVIDTEQELNYQDPPIRGFLDVIFKLGDDEIIGEIKSAKQEVFEIRKTQMKPSLNHMLQLLLYMYVLDKRYGVFIYENKNTQELLLIPLTMNQRRREAIESVLEWMRLVHQTWQAGTLPVRPFTKKSRVCKNCPLFEDCWSGPQGDITIEEMPVSSLQ